MSLYEIRAEEKNYAAFHRRPMIKTAPHFHGAVEWLFVEKGEFQVVVGGEKRLLKAGDACFSDSFTVHSYEKDDDSSVFVIIAARSYSERFFATKGEKVPPRFFRFDNFGLLDSLHKICNKRHKNAEDGYAAIEGATYILLAEIADKTEFVERKTDRQSAIVCDILQYAERHMEEDLSLARLSSLYGFSREHLSRLLHKHLTENWNSYVGRLRARRVHELLREQGGGSVLEAAFACGFESPNTFYRAYKREYGKPPRE